MKAIVYVSNTGATKKYAELLGERINLPVYGLKESKKQLQQSSEIVFLGWIRAGRIMGYNKAKKIYKIKALIGVGIGETGTQIEELRTKNDISNDVALMSLQGWFHLNDLHGMYHLMMKMMLKKVGSNLEKNDHRSPEEDSMLQVMKYGKNPVCVDSLKEVISWYEKRNKIGG